MRARGRRRDLRDLRELARGQRPPAEHRGQHASSGGVAHHRSHARDVRIAVLAGVLLREGFPRALLVGCGVSFAGAVVIGLATSGRGVDAGWGAALCLAAAAAYAGGVVAQKPLLERTSALQVTFLACAVGAVACLPYAPALIDEAGRATGSAVGWTAYLGAFPTALGFTSWAYALRHTTA